MRYKYLVSSSYVSDNNMHTNGTTLYTKKKMKYCMNKVIDFIKKENEIDESVYLHIVNIQYMGKKA